MDALWHEWHHLFIWPQSAIFSSGFHHSFVSVWKKLCSCRISVISFSHQPQLRHFTTVGGVRLWTSTTDPEFKSDLILTATSFLRISSSVIFGFISPLVEHKREYKTLWFDISLQNALWKMCAGCSEGACEHGPTERPCEELDKTQWNNK